MRRGRRPERSTSPDTAVGAVEVDVSLEALVGGQGVTVGSTTTTTVLDPTVSDNPVAFTIQPDASLAGADLQGLDLRVHIHGPALDAGFVGLSGKSWVDMPAFAASVNKAVAVSVDDATFAHRGAGTARRLARWSVAIPTPAVGKHTIYARSTQGFSTSAAVVHDLHGEEVSDDEEAPRSRGARGCGRVGRRTLGRKRRCHPSAHLHAERPERRQPALQPPPVCCAPAGPPVAGEPAPVNMAYFGGHVQVTPKIYLVFWGWGQAGAFDHTTPGVPSYDPDGAAARMTAFVKAMGGTTWAGSQTQYYETVNGVRTSTSRTRRTCSAASGTTTRTRSTTT